MPAVNHPALHARTSAARRLANGAPAQKRDNPMGTNLPGYNPDAINWLEAHIGEWLDNPAAIGLTAQQVTEMATHITAARVAATDANTHRFAAQVATVAAKGMADDMRLFAAPLIANIKNYALNSADPSAVYQAASIQPRKSPAPVAPPAQPVNLMPSLNGDGSISLTFEATGPVGSTWSITRKLHSESKFSHVGFAAPSPKVFTDHAIPAGEQSVTYSVQGIRGGTFGPVSPFVTVQFGNPALVGLSAAAPRAKAA